MLSHAWAWLEPRAKSILLILIAVIVVVAAFWILVKRQESISLKAQLEYFDILKVKNEAARALKLEDFAKKHPGEDIALQALMQLGAYNYGQGDYEKAAVFYGDVVSETGGELMHFVAVDAISPVYVELGKPEDAAELYLNAADAGSNPNPFSFKFKAAGLFELAGDFNRAEEIYRDLIEDENTPAPIKLKAEEQLLWIAVSKQSS